MATLWRKTMYHLGLAPEDEYDDYDDQFVDEPMDRSDRRPAGAPRRPVDERPPPRAQSHRGTATHGDTRTESSAIGAVRPIRTAEASEITAAPLPERPSPVVRPVPIAANAKPHALTPVSFEDAQELADKFKGNQPVIMNLQNADRDLARRLIDFASGLCYGVGGQMEKVANSVYLLTPSNVEVSAEERRRMQEQDFSGR
ncbi:MAG: cell division protein SepF [Actinobacteria bacterium]|nr:cell division protein SepF [Actinomycetota bacterium]